MKEWLFCNECHVSLVDLVGEVPSLEALQLGSSWRLSCLSCTMGVVICE